MPVGHSLAGDMAAALDVGGSCFVNWSYDDGLQLKLDHHRLTLTNWPTLRIRRQLPGQLQETESPCDSRLPAWLLAAIGEYLQPSAIDSDADAAFFGVCQEVFAFCDQVPKAALQMALEYGCHWLRMLQCFARLGNLAMDCHLRGSRSLLFAVAHLEGFVDMRDVRTFWPTARSLLARGEGEAWGVLGMSGGESTARLMRKAIPWNLSPFLLKGLDAVQGEHREVVCGLPQLHHDLLVLLAHHEICRRLAPSETASVGNDWNCESSDLPAGISQLAAHLAAGRFRLPRSVQSIAHLEQLIDEANRRFTQRNARLRLYRRPLPLLPAQIEPLLRPRDVAAEGAAMTHCAAQMIPRLARGTSCMFRLNADRNAGIDRATVLAEWCEREQRLIVTEVSGYRNQAVTQETHAFCSHHLQRRCLTSASSVDYMQLESK